MLLKSRPLTGHWQVEHDDLATDLTLIGITRTEDPLREGVQEAVAKCKKAGVRVTMCSCHTRQATDTLSKLVIRPPRGSSGAPFVRKRDAPSVHSSDLELLLDPVIYSTRPIPVVYINPFTDVYDYLMFG